MPFFSLKRTVSGILLLLFIVLAGYMVTPLPDTLYNHDYSRVITDQNDVLLGALIANDDQWRFPVTEALPAKYIKALTYFEDKRFFSHPGVDPFALARAIKLNLKHDRIVSGGSTITMQLARMISGNRARNYWHKFQEILLAIKLETKLTKKEILKYYAGLAPFGGNTVGLAAANWRYFNTRLKDISWSQAALLAILPNTPSSIHLGKNRKSLLNKRDKLLKELNAAGFISDIDLKLALHESLPKKPVPMPVYTRHLLQTLKLKFPETRAFRSYIHLELQKHLISLLDSYNKAYEKNNVHNLSVIVIDNYSQKTIAYIGNSTRSKLNEYAPDLDITQKPRSSGSLFKPFLFAEMLEQGYILPDSLIEDIPSYYDGYSPKNYDRDYRGLIPAKLALSQSLNVPAVRMLKEYGISQFKEDLQSFGLSTLWRPASEYGLSLILGGAETTLWEITNSFSRMSLSAMGEEITNIEASMFEQHKVEKKEFPVEQGAAWLTLNALIEVNRPGVATNWKEFSSSQKIAWKTGTSYGWHDAWAVGTNGKYTVGVWAGNANGEEARRLTGTQTSAPVMFDVFSFLEEAEFPAKPYVALKEYKVCEIDAYLPAEGCKTKIAYAPRQAHFSVRSKYHKRVYIDPETNLRVHGLCEKVNRMNAKSYFIVPPLHSRYFSDVNFDIELVPEWRPDCLKNLPLASDEVPFDLEYPAEGAQVRIPVELDGKLGRMIVKAYHKDPKAILFWHIDKQALSKTTFIHEKEIVVNPGWHKLTLVDNNGYKITRWFKAI